jgi:hypothetical protein
LVPGGFLFLKAATEVISFCLVPPVSSSMASICRATLSPFLEFGSML